MQPLPPVVGEIVRIDDIDTGFSSDNPKLRRRYLVIDVRNGRARVVPLCRKAGSGIWVEDDDALGDAHGWFVKWSRSLSVDLVSRCEQAGHLSLEHVIRVKAQWQQRKEKANPEAPKPSRLAEAKE